jgi:hypothetical protein
MSAPAAAAGPDYPITDGLWVCYDANQETDFTDTSGNGRDGTASDPSIVHGTEAQGAYFNIPAESSRGEYYIDAGDAWGSFTSWSSVLLFKTSAYNLANYGWTGYDGSGDELYTFNYTDNVGTPGRYRTATIANAGGYEFPRFGPLVNHDLTKYAGFVATYDGSTLTYYIILSGGRDAQTTTHSFSTSFNIAANTRLHYNPSGTFTQAALKVGCAAFHLGYTLGTSEIDTIATYFNNNWTLG